MKKLYRSQSDKMIAGVCGGLADYIGMDPTLIRLAFLLLIIAGLSGFWLYLVCWIVIPLEPGTPPNSVEVNHKPAAAKPKQLAKPEKVSTEKPEDTDTGEAKTNPKK